MMNGCREWMDKEKKSSFFVLSIFSHSLLFDSISFFCIIVCCYSLHVLQNCLFAFQLRQHSTKKIVKRGRWKSENFELAAKRRINLKVTHTTPCFCAGFTVIFSVWHSSSVNFLFWLLKLSSHDSYYESFSLWIYLSS